MVKNKQVPSPPPPPSVRQIKDGVGIISPKEVYCCDCRWVREYFCDFMGVSTECGHPSLFKVKKHPILGRIEVEDESIPPDYRDPKYLNRDLDCAMYQRKWWKFWR